MPEVELEKMSGGALTNLRKGRPCRCALAKTAGSGMKVHMSEDKIKDLMRAAKRGAKKTLSLSKEEIEKSGSGLYAKGGKIKMKKVLKTAKKIGKSEPVQALKKAALHELEDMAIVGAESLGVPAPVAKMATKPIAKKIDKSTGGKISLHKAKKHAVKAAKKHHVGRKAKNFGLKAGSEAAGDLGAAAGSMLGGPAGAVLGKTAAQGAYSAATKGAGVVAGGAIGPEPGPESFVRLGGQGHLLTARNPALLSQPASANWSMHTQLPPTLASRITGSGLYARGNGIYGGSPFL